MPNSPPKKGHKIGGSWFIMEAENYHSPHANGPQGNSNDATRNTIPVIEEQLRVDKKVVETGKVHVSKKVTEHETSVSLPLMEETYDVERVPINQVVETPPPPVRYEGDTMIIPVMREVMVVQKHYEVVEEIRLTKQVSRQQHSEQVTLKKEEVQVDRSRSDGAPRDSRDRNY